jgi:hypothetical protein
MVHKSIVSTNSLKKGRNNMNIAIELIKLPYEAKVALANDKQAYPEFLAVLATDNDARIRENVALNSGTPSEVLDTLANDCDSAVRKAVAENKNTSADSLTVLAKDKVTNLLTN